MARKLRRLAYSMSALWALLLSPEANAKIPPTKLKGVTRYFKQGKELNSPLLGEVALETGLVTDIRLYGDFESAYDKEGKRDWVKDKSENALWNLSKNLFPSPGGSLSPVTNARSNFGKYVVRPETVSILLNFCNHVRTSEKKQWSKKDLEAAKKQTREMIVRTLNIKDRPDAPDVVVEGKQAEFLNSQEHKALDQSINQIIGSIYQSIKDEKNSLTPKGTTEQLVTAFFCDVFSTHEHIEQLLVHLDDNIVDRELVRNFQGEDYGLRDLDAIKDRLKDVQDTYSLDDLYALSNDSLLAGITPYKSGVNLIAQNVTASYDRRRDQFTDQGGFVDCFEQVIRHICNLGAWNSATRAFDLTNLKRYVAENLPDSPYVKNLDDFFTLETPENANDGDIKYKSAFNRFVGDLNAFDDTIHVDYNKGNNELLPGYNNLIKVFQKTIGLRVENMPQDNEASKKNWLRDALGQLFNAFNPNLNYEVNVDQVKEEQEELVGLVPVSVKDKETNEFLYKYVINLTYRTHGQIEGFEDKIKRDLDDEYEMVLDHKNLIHDNTAEDSVRLLFKNAFYEHQIAHPGLFYGLFHQSLENDNARKDFLDQFNHDYPNMGAYQKTLLTSLGHVLESIRWESNASMKLLTPSLLRLAQHEELRPLIQQYMKGFYYNPTEEEIKFMKNEKAEEWGSVAMFSNVKKLTAIGTSIQDLDKLIGIEDLSLYKNGENTLSLEAHPELKKLELGLVKNVKGLDKLSKLEKIRLANVEADSLDLSRSTLLKELSLIRTTFGQGNFNFLAQIKNLEKLVLNQVSIAGNPIDLNIPAFEKLGYMSLNGLHLRKLGFGDMPALSDLILNNLDEIEELDFSSLKHLKSLALSGKFDNLKTIKFAPGQVIDKIIGLDKLEESNKDLVIVNRPASRPIVDERVE